MDNEMIKAQLELEEGSAIMKTSTVPIQAVSSALEAFKDFTGDGDVQIQTLQIFLRIVLAGSTTANYVDLAKTAGITQPAVTRNLKKLGDGPRSTPGYSLVHIELDPYDSRRRVITITQRGEQLMAHMQARMLPHLQRYVDRQESVSQ